MANTIKLGTDSNWAVKENNLLAYNDENNIFKPIDFEFTRDSGATRVNEQGLIENVPSGVPRIDFSDGKGSLLLEPLSRNLITHSNEFDNVVWFNTIDGSGVNPIITPSVGLSPDGSNNAYRIQADQGVLGATNRSAIAFNFSITTELDYTITLYVKSNTGSDQSFNIDSTGIVSPQTFTATSEWQRFEVNGQGLITGGQQLRIGLINNANNTTCDLLIYGVMVEQQSYATSYIPTSGATATRNADTASKTGLGNYINSSEGVFYAEIKTDKSTASYIELNDGTSSNRISIGYSGLSAALRFVNSTDNITRTEPTTRTNYNKLAVKWSATEVSLFLNGIKTDTITPSASVVGLSKIDFSTAASFQGKVKDVRVYNQALTDTQLQQLTS